MFLVYLKLMLGIVGVCASKCLYIVSSVVLELRRIKGALLRNASG